MWYTIFPGDCSKYVQCWDNNGNIQGTVRQCPFGQFWKQDEQTCATSSNIRCDIGKLYVAWKVKTSVREVLHVLKLSLLFRSLFERSQWIHVRNGRIRLPRVLDLHEQLQCWIVLRSRDPLCGRHGMLARIALQRSLSSKKIGQPTVKYGPVSIRYMLTYTLPFPFYLSNHI